MIEPTTQTIESAPDADSPYNTVMKTWARWMALADHQHSEGNAHPQDVKEFMACGEAVDAMVNDLPIHYRWAIRRAYGLATAWIYPDKSLADTLVAAELVLEPKLMRNVATRRYFR
jgi:hypothetical protein